MLVTLAAAIASAVAAAYLFYLHDMLTVFVSTGLLQSLVKYPNHMTRVNHPQQQNNNNEKN